MSIYSKITVPSSNKQVPSTRMYKGFSTVNTGTQNFTLYDFELIKQDLMNPDFGTIIWDLIFEPLTEEIKSAILQNVNQIVNYDPRVQASNVLVTSYDTGIQIQVTLTYLPYNLSENLKMRFDQANGLVI